jgi:acyl-CoA thioester hydrolase
VLTVRTAVTELKRTSFWVSYQVWRGDAVVASGRSAQVFFDYQAQRPTAMPQAFRERIASYEGLSPELT